MSTIALTADTFRHISNEVRITSEFDVVACLSLGSDAPFLLVMHVSNIGGMTFLSPSVTHYMSFSVLM